MKRIIYQTECGGVAVIIPTGELPIEEVAAKDVPPGVPYEIVTTDDIPSDRTFRNAWVIGNGCIEHDLDQCRDIGHDIRRTMRAEEFQPFDEIIAKQIPGLDAAEAEANRQAIRKKYALVQVAIEASEDADAIKQALLGL